MPSSERERREDLEPTRGRVEPSPELVAPRAAAVLRMQESVGNRATTELLARVPARGSGKPEPVPDNIPSGTLDIEGYGVYQASSWRVDKANELVVFFGPDVNPTRLFNAAHRGEHIKRAVFYNAGRRITLTDVLVSSVRAVEATTEVALNAGKIDW